MTAEFDPRRRRLFLGTLGAALAGQAAAQPLSPRKSDMVDTGAPELILHNGRFTTLARSNPTASAVAIRDGRFTHVGHSEDILPLAAAGTRVVDLRGRPVLPGLIDNHLHIIRGGLNYNLELRWDGVRSLADAMAMLKRQVAITPAPQWVRVVGGFTEHQFAEKRLPTIAELNAVAPDTPVFLLHLYDRALLNGAALRAVGYTKETPAPPGRRDRARQRRQPDRAAAGQAEREHPLCDLGQGPKLPFDYQLNSTRHFMRELNRLGVTGAIDAGGGFQNYPEDYQVIQQLADAGQLTIRLAYNLFTQKPKQEKQDFLNWTATSKYKQGDDYFRHNGAGEMLVFSAADFEDFRQPRPDMAPEMEGELEEVVRVLAAEQVALAAARDLRRDHRARARRLREGESRHAAGRAELVLRPLRDDLREVDRPHRGARRRHRGAASHGLPGRVFRRALRRRRGRGDAAR